MEVAISTDNLVCASCQIDFQNQSSYKEHYGTKFHQYNIKRKLLNLPPATLEQYQERKEQFTTQKQQQNLESYKTVKKNYCSTCGKQFGNENTFKSHMLSKKHSEKLAKSQQTSQQSSLNQSKSSIYPKNSLRTTINDQSICLFCDKKQSSLDKNLVHMEKVHGFFIPERKYCKDTKGLLKYLGEKINIGLLCLECENKGRKDFKTPEGLKMHMIDQGHCFMNLKQIQEYAEYFDFSANLDNPEIEEAKDDEDEDGDEKEEHKNNNNDDEQEDEGEDDEWEDEESEEEDDEEEDEEDKSLQGNKNQDGELKQTKEERLKQRKLERDFLRSYRNLNLQRIAKFDVNPLGEIELNDGEKVIGHRKYKNQYKMYYRNKADPLAQLKGILGESGTQNRQVMIAKKLNQIMLKDKVMRHKDYRLSQKQDYKNKFRENQTQLKTQMRNNKTKMHHFVNQNPL